MKEITELFDNTPLGNPVFRVFSTDTGELDFGYTPQSITTWNRGQYDHHDPRNVSYAVHEIAHVIDLCGRSPERILQNNFGYPRRNHLTNKTMHNEIRVLAIQSILETANPTLATPYDTDGTHAILTEHHKIPCNRDDFVTLLEQAKEGLIVERLYRAWQKACLYVYMNRK